jgi:competence protein ComEC
VAQLRTALVAAPVLQKKLGPVTVEGRLVRIEVLTKGRRLWLDGLSIGRLDRDRTPQRIRVKLFGRTGDLGPGDRVRLRAVLYPPAGPAMPGAFDFARRAFFAGLGGVGYAVSRPVLVGRASSGGLAVRLAALRYRLTREIYRAMPGPAGAVAAALMTGERGAIPEDVLAAMRESGLAHLLAISGLHMGLVGGLLFFAVRLCLALHERTALRYPIKKWAAGAALLGSLAYLLISGATLPTQRAFLMLSLVMLAVAIDRSAISMNMVAWAAGVILLISPESLMSVSYQMSFAAVTALVAVYELDRTRRLNHAGGQSAPRRAALYLSAVLLSTLIAGAATAPFALYHFNQVTLYGMAANLLAVPLTALWVMPWAIAAFILMPFGLAGLALVPMGWGIDGVIYIAKTVQALPGAVALFPSMPAWGLGLLCLGGLWLCLWRLPWRFIGLCPIAIGFAAIATVRTPDILVSDTGRLAAVKGQDGRLLFPSRARGFIAETWLRRAGQAAPAAGPAPGPGPMRCDALGCIVRTGGEVVALVKMAAALPDDCRLATILVSRVPVRKWRCRGPRLVVDRYDVWRAGAHAVWLTPGGIDVKTVAGTGGNRPWSRYPPRRRRQ